MSTSPDGLRIMTYAELRLRLEHCGLTEVDDPDLQDDEVRIWTRVALCGAPYVAVIYRGDLTRVWPQTVRRLLRIMGIGIDNFLEAKAQPATDRA